MLSHYAVTKQDRQSTDNITMRHGRVTIVLVQKQCVTYSECVFVALGIQHGVSMRHIVICGLPRPKIIFSTLSHKWHNLKKKILY